MIRKLALLSALTLSACVSVPKDAGFSDLQQTTSQSFPVPVEWVGSSISESDAEVRIAQLLSEPLREDAVLELGLLSSRDLRATLYGLKAARGDYVDGVALPNPFLSAVVFDVQGESTTNLEFGGGYELLDLLFMPRRIKAAKAGFDGAKIKASEQFIDYALDARLVYYEALAAQQMLDLSRQSAQAVEVSANTAKAIYEAGNTPKVEYDRQALLASQMQIVLLSAQQEARTAKAQLANQLGLIAGQAEVMTLKGRLRNPPKEDQAVWDVEAIQSDNLFLASKDADLRAAAARMGVTDVTSLIGDLELEYARERDHGQWEAGYGAGLELPIFNMGQGQREAARARLMMMQAQKESARRTLDVSAQLVKSNLETAREKALLQRQETLPLAGQVLKGAQLDYNAMQIGVFSLLAAKRDQLAAGQNYILALKEYWSARARYEHVLAGGTPELGGSMTTMIKPASGSDEGDH